MLFHLGDVGICVKRLEQLRIKYLSLVKMLRKLKCGGIWKKNRERKIRKNKKENIIIIA